MIRILLISIVLSCCSLLAQSQGTILLKGQVNDALDQSPLSSAHISVLSQKRATSSNAQGRFKLALNADPSIQVKISHVAFEDTTVTLRISPDQKVYFINVSLNFKTNLISEAIVKDWADTVYGVKEHHVADFVFRGEDMLILSYEKERYLKKENEQNKTYYEECSLVLLDKYGRVRSSLALAETCVEFYSDCLDDVFLRTKYNDYLIELEDSLITPLILPEGNFESIVIPLIDSLNGRSIYTTFHPSYPALEYYSIDNKDSTVINFKFISDEPLMEMFRAEYKWLSGRQKLEAYRMELYSGIDKEIFGAYLSGFPQSTFYEEIYAPLFVNNDTILIFDHYENQLYTYDTNFYEVDSVPIDYHLGKQARNWEKSILIDEENGDVYSVYLKSGVSYLKKINRKSGEIEGTFSLSQRYPEKVKIKNGQVYYVYRPFGTTQKKFLYKETINLSSLTATR